MKENFSPQLEVDLKSAEKRSYEKEDFAKFGEVGDYFWSALVDEEGWHEEFLASVPSEHYFHPHFDELLKEGDRKDFLKLAISAIQDQKIGRMGVDVFTNYEFADQQLYALDNYGDEPGAEIEVLVDLLRKFQQLEISTEEADENLNFLINFWQKNRASIIFPVLAEIFNKIDPNKASGKLLQLLKQEIGDKNYLSALLYRLEFGQIGISESGVKYLEKNYDLAELNNPDYFAQRLTASGEIGIFDENRILQKYFELGDLAAPEQNVKPRVHDFVYETLFRPRTNETEVERAEREQYLKEFKENYFHFYDDEFFAQTGVRFNNLEFEEQGWFLMYYRHADEETKESLLKFIKTNGEIGLKAFLSLEYNDHNGAKILLLNEHLEPKEIKEIFARYIKIQHRVQNLAQHMQTAYFLEQSSIAEGIKNNLKDNFYDAVMSRATDILNTACQLAENKKAIASFYGDQEITVDKIADVIEALEIYEEFLDKLNGLFLEQGNYKFELAKKNDLGEMAIYDFAILDQRTQEKSFAAIALRVRGAEEHLAEYEYDGEARINFLFNNQPISAATTDSSRAQALSFRLDRECLNFDEAGKVVSRDNTRSQGQLSLDLGSLATEAGEQNNILARVVSVGNFQAAQEKSEKPEYYHNKESFYQSMGQADIFAQIVILLKDFIEEKYINKD